MIEILEENIVCLFIGHKEGERRGYPVENNGFVTRYCQRCNSIYSEEEKKA